MKKRGHEFEKEWYMGWGQREKNGINSKRKEINKMGCHLRNDTPQTTTEKTKREKPSNLKKKERRKERI